MSYLDRLRQLPQKKLIRGFYHLSDEPDGAQVCAIGACLPEVRELLETYNGNKISHSTLALHPDLTRALDDSGLSLADARRLQIINDGLTEPYVSDEERYELILRIATLVAEKKWTFAAACNFVEEMKTVMSLRDAIALREAEGR